MNFVEPGFPDSVVLDIQPCISSEVIDLRANISTVTTEDEVRSRYHDAASLNKHAKESRNSFCLILIYHLFGCLHWHSHHSA